MLEFLLRQWLGRTVRQRAYDAAREAAFDHLSQTASSTKPSEPKPDRPADVGIVLATSLEAGACEDRLEGVLAIETQGFKFRQGGLRGRSVVLVTAHSAATAAAAAELLIAGHHPRWIICAGDAAGLKPDVSRGDFLLASEVCDEHGGRLAIDVTAPAATARGPRVHCGRLLSLDRDVTRAAEKESLGREHAALAVDRQSLAVAEVCRREKTRLMSICIISEAMSDEPPRDLQRLGRKKTSAARWGATLGAIVNRPSSVKDMLQTKENALVDADRLAKFLEGVILQLACEKPAE
jgi:adenosylhomocysteine nucleosidase